MLLIAILELNTEPLEKIDMKYMGSKARHAKELLPIILKDRKPGQWYVEPFVGGANMIDKVDEPRIGSDVNPFLITLLNSVANGWQAPSSLSELEYSSLKNDQNINDPLVGFAGFGCSFGGKFFGGYARGKNSTGGWRNYAAETKRNLEKQASSLRGILFICSSYKELVIPKNSIIYCDPPYAGTTKYATGGFDHAAFWQWCDEQVESGHTVFVSEYSAPDHWECVWEKSVTANFDSGRVEASARTEKLFTRTKNA